MKVASLKENYLLNLVRVFYGFLIGIVSTPYILKTLGPENLGKVDFINSYISYIQVIACLGLPLYGVREISKVKDNVTNRSKLICEIFIILTVTTVLSYFFLFFSTLFIDNVKSNYKLLLIMAPMLFFSNFSIDWFYQGIENQRVIFLRTIIVRTLSFISLFIFVRNRDDYFEYGVILMLTIVINTGINLYYLKKYVEFSELNFKMLEFNKHYKPLMVFLLAAFSNSLYMDLTTFFLGTISGNKYVGYFSLSNKLVRMAITVTSVFAAVLLPRFSALYNNDIKQYNILLAKAFRYILFLILPFFIIIYSSSSQLILIFSNEQYLPAETSLKILSTIIIFVGIAYFLSYFIIYPMGKEKVYTYSVLYSSIISIVVGYFLIRYYQHVGAAILVAVAELLGPIFMILFMWGTIKKIDLKLKSIINYSVAGILMYASMRLFYFINLDINIYLYFLLNVTISFLIFFTYLLITADQIVLELKNMVFKKLKLS
ncbi:flippase [uncultured Chryseobacterium sp.]|uniref:flippase n=1 Tax=uncultured Chryseobacterium sp. TaxID=259322 RepID=UPI0025CC4AC9|nr:flippase [uncultured Chryseobacterium sp.]